MSYMNINYFLESVENEAITYPNITQDDIDIFKVSTKERADQLCKLLLSDNHD